MKLVKCENDHFYDADKFLSCPHCANRIAEPEVKDLMGTNQGRIPTLPSDGTCADRMDSDITDFAATSPGGAAVSKCPSAVLGKTVGWLVCIDGLMRGESFVLREGDNCIGRAGNMDVPLLCEPTVSRNRHAVITYDAVHNSFLLHSPEKIDKILLNEKSIKKPKTLKNHDVITLGDCSLLFVALCGASFRWNEGETEQ